MRNFNELHETDNIGGIAQLFIALVDDLVSTNPITFKAGAGWQKINFHPETASMKSDIQSGDSGKYHSYAGSFKIGKLAVREASLIMNFLGPVCIIKVVDFDGAKFIVGTKEEPVNLAQLSDSGVKPADFSHHNFTFNCEQLNPALR